jgi:hypothetical protein
MKDLLADISGHLLERPDVEFLASRNMEGSSERQNVEWLTDYDLVQWAANADGEFDPDQMNNYDIELVAAAEPGDAVSREFVRK